MRKTGVVVLILTLLAACTAEPEVVEITRVVTEVQEVVVSQVVTEVVAGEEVQVEVTRLVEVADVGWQFGEPADTDNDFTDYGNSPFVPTTIDNLSTFALDVDTGSYTVMRSFVERGQLPPSASVRVEEYVNYFDQGYAPPSSGVFQIHLEGAPAPYGPDDSYYLVRVGLQGYEVPESDRPDALLIFVVDVSGSMEQPNRLPLVKQSLTYLVANLRDTDRVGIVTYGDTARIHLAPTPVRQRGDLLSAIEQLAINGSTNVEQGLAMAYDLAEQYASPGQINRLVLLSDGVANVGNTVADSILQHAEDGIALSTFGFGMDSYNDTLMEQLADQGDGSYAYIDTIDEAVRVFDTQLTTTLLTIARDAKVQVEFNPAVVSSYRLLGYENRAVADADFTNDAVDAGEIGAGHSVTALYEIQLVADADPEELALVTHLRYLDPADGEVHNQQASLAPMAFTSDFAASSPHFQLAAAVAEFAEMLGQSPWAQDGDPAQLASDILRIAGQLPGDETVLEFVRLALAAIDQMP